MTFPAHPDALSTQWLSAALNENVTDFRVEYFGEGAGIIGMVTRVHLTSDGAERTIIAKFPSPAEENRAVAAVYDMYAREVNFYQHIAKHIDLRVPDCYYAAFNADNLDFILLLEDLQGMRIGDQVAGCNEIDAKHVVEGIARFHASTWETQRDVVSHNNPGQRDGMIAGFEMGWPVVQAQFADLIPAEAESLAQNMPKHVGRLLETMCQPPICIAHADVRLDNIFFSDEGIALVDWQSVCTSAPEHDLAYFVTQSLPETVRDAQDWVAIYHTILAEAGINYSLAECRERFRVCATYLLCYAVVIAGTLDLGNERGMALGRTLFGNAMRALTALDAFELLA